jgi:SAM-dependent MidA family methyltransferase
MTSRGEHPRPWQQAWSEALYGPDGFFLREVPGHHFRTNVANPQFPQAVRRIADRLDETLGHPDPFDVVDVGAGRGELLQSLGVVPSRWRLTGVDRAAADVPFAWGTKVPVMTGLLIANEWLDSIPLRVLEDGREVLVDHEGQESLGEPVSSAWADRWWPRVGRVEEGSTRDAAWQHVVGRVARGLALAIDYGHVLGSRRPTLTGYAHGHQVPPLPDGSRDLTAHVALDSCAAATGARLLVQHEALRAVGVSAKLPAAADPAYPTVLEAASQARELLDPQGLGGFGWLVQEVGLPAGWMPW